MNRIQKIIISLPSLIAMLYWTAGMFPTKFGWLYPSMYSYNVQNIAAWLLVLAQVVFLLNRIWRIEKLDKQQKTKWTLLMIFFSFISTFIYVWFYDDLYSKDIKKKLAILKVETEGYEYIIEEDLPDVGWYIYRYDSSGKLTHDYLQDTEEIAKEFCKEKFGIQIDRWEYA